MFEKEAEEIEKEAIKWVKDVFPNDEFKQSGISRALVEFAELGYNKAIVWHKVADGDLPNNYHYVWTNVGAGYHDDDGWWDDFGRLQNVIAWCEPKFEE